MSKLVIVGLLCGAFGGIVISVLLLVFAFKRTLFRLARIGLLMYTGHVPSWGALGNAVMGIQRLAQPQYECVLERKEDESRRREEDGKGAG